MVVWLADVIRWGEPWDVEDDDRTDEKVTTQRWGRS